uniref:Ubiquitin-like domain-containing protein n=1 Tax=Panagrolaimus superbus TaxID=310955 RepID=A0A914YIV0_9BILA
MNVFVRYRRINDEWKDVDIRQSRISLNPLATIETLINHLGSKWSINPNELLVRVYDKDFGEFIDIDMELDSVELQNLTKYEIVHRVGKWARKVRTFKGT